jgi:hypothetical protein
MSPQGNSRLANLLVAIVAEMEAAPDASAWKIAERVKGRRADVLRLIRLARAAGIGEQSTEPSQDAGTGSPSLACPACGVSLDLRVERSTS